MNVKISLTNSKLSGQIPSVNLPPIKTCRAGAPCSNGCYAKRGKFNCANVKTAHLDNLACFVADSKKYFDDIISFLNGLVSYKYFRYHSSGDIVNDDYFAGMIRTAKKCKNVKFLCFTKKFEIVNDYLNAGGVIPKNLKIVFSAWDKSFKVDNPHNLPVAYVRFKNKDINPNIPELSIPCVGKCYECQSCWSLKNGQSVVFKKH